MTTMKRVILGVAALLVGTVSGCGGSTTGGDPVADPFTTLPGVESGPGSGSWGDGTSGPRGLETGCIDGRKLAVLITVHNATMETITVLGGDGDKTATSVVEPVAVQVSLRPPPLNVHIAQPGLRSWN